MRGLALALVLILVGMLAPASTASSEGASPERYLVGFYEMPDLEVGDRYLDGVVVGLDAALGFLVVETADPVSFGLRARLDDAVRYVEWDDPTFGRVSLVPNDARYNDAGHYGSKKIGAEKAWDRTLGSTAVKVGVIDSGLRKTHEEFATSGRVLQGYDFTANDNDPNDDCGHGTHVAGTIAATINNGKGIAGMAQVTIVPIKGLKYDINPLYGCSGSVSGLASALRYAADQGTAMSSNSWGGGSATAINDAITYSLNKGTVVIAAAGNSGGCTNCVDAPWKENAAKVIIVSSTDASDALSSFSSQGPEVDVAAPGTSILSSYNSNDASYSSLSGTSMATPHVTGLAALLKTQNPAWGYTEIDQRLKTTAVDLGAAGKDDKFGFGRINADAATAGSTPPPPGNVAPTACFTHSESGLATSVSSTCSSDSDGTIASRTWSWGDGTPTSSGTTASHTYAAAGTYTVTLTVTDDDGASSSTSQQVTVTAPSGGGDPDPSTPTIANGQTVTATNGASGSWQYYKVSVPAGRSQLQVVLDGQACGLLSCNPDLDLHVRKGARPTTSAYDCGPLESDSDETCTLANPAADWWYIGVYVYSGSSAKTYTIRATY